MSRRRCCCRPGEPCPCSKCSGAKSDPLLLDLSGVTFGALPPDAIAADGCCALFSLFAGTLAEAISRINTSTYALDSGCHYSESCGCSWWLNLSGSSGPGDPGDGCQFSITAWFAAAGEDVYHLPAGVPAPNGCPINTGDPADFAFTVPAGKWSLVVLIHCHVFWCQTFGYGGGDVDAIFRMDFDEKPSCGICDADAVLALFDQKITATVDGYYPLDFSSATAQIVCSGTTPSNPDFNQADFDPADFA